MNLEEIIERVRRPGSGKRYLIIFFGAMLLPIIIGILGKLFGF